MNGQPAIKYTYRDLVTRKQRFTRGRFLGWHGPDGLLQTYYAMFQRKSDVLFIPVYLLSIETRALLPQPPQQ